jgi:nucleoid-associated protein YgaU
MTGFGHKARPVGERIVREVMKDLGTRDGSALPPWLETMRRFAPPPRVAVGAATAVLALGLLGVGLGGREPKPVAEPPAAAPVARAVAPAPVPAPAPPPAIREAETERPVHNQPPEPLTLQIAEVAEVHEAQPVKARTLRIVAPGDTLSLLSTQVYGRMDRAALDWVKHHNPAITDIDRLLVGQIIEFPPLP